jgi:Tfp pilus assembly protein PilO
MNLRLHYLQMRRWGSSLLGWPGAIGVGALAMCLVLYLAVLLPAQQRLDMARYNASSMQERIARASEVLNDKAHPVDEQLATFYRIFPSEDGLTDWIGKIAEIAQRDGLDLQEAEYKADRDKTGKLIRIQMRLPLKGEYQKIRKFLFDLRAEIPIVSLDRVEFERQKVGDLQVDAKVMLAIFLGHTS